MSDIMSNRNATASWHGYTHQSKVGVLLALRKINELLEKDETINNWIIKFESAEDFDIMHGSKVNSRHQVKAYKNGNYPNAYKDVLQEAYPIINGEMTKETQAFQYRSIKEDNSPGEIEVDEGSRYLHTIVEVEGFGLTEEEFEKVVPPQTVYIPNPNKVQLYQYNEHEYFCDFSKSDEECKLEAYCVKEIKEILIKENSPFKEIKQIHKEKFLYIVDALDNQVREEHLKEPVGYPTLSLKEILEIVISTGAQERTNTQIMREVFMCVWDDYVEELQLNTPNLDLEIIDDIGSIIKEIYHLNDDKFKNFIIYLNPDQKSVDNLANSQILTTHLQSDSLKDIMYRCLCNITEQTFDRDYLGYKNGKYTLSLINREQASIKSVVGKISNNSEYLKKIHERDFLINGQINNQKVVPEIIKGQDEVNSNWSNENDENKIHIMNSEMKFITATEVIKRINEG
ncbi:ABC-three component system protein [Pelagirhabdus alkalitolerans]|nr:ABC-three component system protein [Pelagirhabdus alkalitolerans]